MSVRVWVGDVKHRSVYLLGRGWDEPVLPLCPALLAVKIRPVRTTLMMLAALSLASCSTSSDSDRTWAKMANVLCSEFAIQLRPQLSAERSDNSQKAARSAMVGLGKKLQEIPTGSPRAHGATEGLVKTAATLENGGHQEMSLSWLPELKAIGATSCWEIFTGPPTTPDGTQLPTNGRTSVAR